MTDARTAAYEYEQRIDELTQVLDACEAANLQHLKRIAELEELCRDMYTALTLCATDGTRDLPVIIPAAKSRMDALGIEVEE